MAYEQAKRVIRGSNTRELTIYERFVAGSFAGSFSQTIIYPLEVGKNFEYVALIRFRDFIISMEIVCKSNERNYRHR